METMELNRDINPGAPDAQEDQLNLALNGLNLSNNSSSRNQSEGGEK